MTSIEQRVEKLERSNLRLKLIMLMAAALFGACQGTHPTANFETVNARRFVVVDQSEKEVGRFEGAAPGAVLNLTGGGKQVRLNSSTQLAP